MLLGASHALSAQSGADAATANGDFASLSFSGSSSAVLFTKEIEASFHGVLDKDFVPVATNSQPAGFVNASPAGQPWNGTMWTRDAGTYLRELTMWGDYKDATLLAHCLIQLVDRNKDGFYSYPRFFRGNKKSSGTELDGSSAIVIGLVLLWEHLPADSLARHEIQSFLLGDTSPVAYFRYLLSKQPLLSGTGEFGCGMQVPGNCDNLVQNNLVRLALIAVSRMENALRLTEQSSQDGLLATKLRDSMEKYLIASDGSWLWAVDPNTLKPDPRVLMAKVNLGFGGMNGVAAMSSDVLGLEPSVIEPDIIQHSEKTFEKIYEEPKRKQQFDRYGIWTQFDALGGGALTSPSYGQGYALQTMLLTDHLQMADKALGWLAEATYRPIPEYQLTRSSPYFFYERYYSPLAVGKVTLAAGCGALNLVNVAEPLKVARLVLGVDDSDPALTVLLPRLPPGWEKMEAHHWPILTPHGVVRADISFTKLGAGAIFHLTTHREGELARLRVRMPSATGYVWRERDHTSSATFTTH
ncbi:MAG TPA: hypothetical protein VFW30_08875 [Bryocella sp.]|nr:hypothetical protein [Bryocella sp.]